MHPNTIFRRETNERNVEFVRSRSFGTLAINSDDGPLTSHVPFCLSEDARSAELHLVRSNPIARMLKTPAKAVICVTGGDGYISPDWYKIDDQVPTWNYVAVRLRGSLSLLPQEELHGLLTRLSATFEERLRPKKPWTSDKMDQQAYTKMLRQIVPLKLDIEAVEGTWKLSQNKPDDVRLRAADGLKDAGIGVETDELAALMRAIGS